jgi:hypothetical protein
MGPTLRDTLRRACTAWYGHDYQPMPDGKRIYCRICGDVIDADRRPR